MTEEQAVQKISAALRAWPRTSQRPWKAVRTHMQKDPDHWARQALDSGQLTVADAARPGPAIVAQLKRAIARGVALRQDAANRVN